MDMNMENPTTVDGVRAIEMRYRAIWSAEEKLPAFYQSTARLNSPEMGVLLPERFMPVLETDDRCISVFKLVLLQLMKTSDKLEEREVDFDWISVFIPLRMLKKSNSVRTVREFTGMMGALPKKICFEVPAEGIYESGSQCIENLMALRKAGYHTMVTDVDGESFPMFRLSEIRPEYVMLKDNITRRIGESDRSDDCIRSLINVIGDMGSQVIATGISTAAAADSLYELGCSYFAAHEGSEDFSGRYISDRFIRRKGSEQ
ncbi:MAG: EAL domain-containing protein [Huintestinicola sp.]